MVIQAVGFALYFAKILNLDYMQENKTDNWLAFND